MTSSPSSRNRPQRSPRNPRSTTTTTTNRWSSRVARPPIILGFEDSHLQVGYAGEATPRHYLKLSSETSPKSLMDWYPLLAATIEDLYARLGQDPRERPVILVVPDNDVMYNRNFQEALTEVLWESKVPAVRFVSSLEGLPLALPTLSTCLVIHITRNQAACVAYAHGHLLSYTWQGIPVNMNSSISNKNIDVTETNLKSVDGWTVKDWQTALENDPIFTSTFNSNNNNNSPPLHLHPHSLVTAIIHCIHAAPISVRKDLVAHLVFAGELMVVLPQLSLLVARNLQKVLQAPHGITKNNNNDNNKESKVDMDDIFIPTMPKNRNILTLSQPCVLKYCRDLAPLADDIGLVQLGPYRADLLAWLGISLWASHWHMRDPSSPVFAWQYQEDEK